MELFEETTLGGKALKNRIFRSATNEHLADRNGRATEELIACYEELAAGGVGTIITGHYCVVINARTSIDQAAIPGNDPVILGEAAERVHRHGARLIMQLSHGGLKAPEAVNGCSPRGPIDFTVEELEELKRLFVDGAKMAKEAGFDGVQIHCAHGYLLSSFVDPYVNTRTDEYGGSVENRFRYPMEIIRAVREACGEDFLILVKLNADASWPAEQVTEDQTMQDSADDGVTSRHTDPAARRRMEYAPTLHRILELCQEASVDAAEISALAFSSQKANRDEPYFLPETLEAKKGIDMPVILVGGLDSRTKLQQALDAGVPYVSLSRSLICQPDFVNRMMDGAEKSPCLRCFACFRVYKSKHVRCVLHKEEIPLLKDLYG